jgi:sulfite reductase (NADPH) hemoprotein beta-component
MSAPSPIESVKAQSRGLRGTLVESLNDAPTGSLREHDQHLLKLHGSYQQDDRDVREERRVQKLEPLWRFMVRVRLPAGICTPAQWLSLDALATELGNSSLRLTTRQTFQFHGIIKHELKPAMQRINATLLDTIATCGDVNRNVMASANPIESPAHAEVADCARRLSEHFLPHTRAYHEIWLDGEKLSGTPEIEPVYGATYLPRKFKAAIALPPSNDVDIFTQDLGFIAIVEEGHLAGFNLTVGGGMGVTHGDAATHPRLADVAGFLPAAALLPVAEAVLTTQRDFGDRANRKHARLKYTIEERGLAWFIGEIETRSGVKLSPARPFRFDGNGDRFGWRQALEGSWHRTLRVRAGRIADRPEAALLSGLREIAKVHRGDFRLTPNQNVTIAGVGFADRPKIDALIERYGLDAAERGTPVARDALACVALPTCGLAMAEAERYLPQLLAHVDAALLRHGLGAEPLILRITGCPNGCARPYVAEVALIGKALGRYNLHLGGDGRGSRLNVLYRENIDEATFLQEFNALIGAWAQGREDGERFGDFLWRTGRLPVAGTATPAS